MYKYKFWGRGRNYSSIRTHLNIPKSRAHNGIIDLRKGKEGNNWPGFTRDKYGYSRFHYGSLRGQKARRWWDRDYYDL